MVVEIIRIMLVHKCIPYHYISHYLFKKQCLNILDYLPNKFLYKIKIKFNDQNVIYYIENKYFFNFFYDSFGINTPKVLMFNDFNSFKTDNEILEIKNSTDFKDVLFKLVNNYGPEGSVFIKKTYGSGSGANIYKVSKQVLGNDEFIASLYQQVIKSGYLFQETIQQHPQMEKINPSSINTIRIDTYIDKSGTIDIMSAHLRMSIKNLHVDNMGAGGCAVSIDLKTGCLKEYGYSLIKYGNGQLYTEHPVTETVFLNYAIPHFEEAKSMVIKAASLMPGLRLVGWDVGISNTGPVLIEGNYDYDITGSDFMYGGYRSNPIFRKALKEIGYIK